MTTQVLKAVFTHSELPREREKLLNTLCAVMKDNPAIKEADGQYVLTLSLEPFSKKRGL